MSRGEVKLNLYQQQPAFLHSDMSQARLPVVKMNRLCCRICCQLLRNTVTIPCGHNFCLQCIQDRWDREESKNRKSSCPECGRQFPSRPLALKRPWSCTETGTSSGGAWCRRHSSPLDIYCCTDEQIICAVCASTEHKGHTIGSVREESRRKQVRETNRNKQYCNF